MPTFTSTLIRYLNEFGNNLYVNFYSFFKYLLYSFIKFFMLTCIRIFGSIRNFKSISSTTIKFWEIILHNQRITNFLRLKIWLIRFPLSIQSSSFLFVIKSRVRVINSIRVRSSNTLRLLFKRNRVLERIQFLALLKLGWRYYHSFITCIWIIRNLALLINYLSIRMGIRFAWHILSIVWVNVKIVRILMRIWVLVILKRLTGFILTKRLSGVSIKNWLLLVASTCIWSLMLLFLVRLFICSWAIF